MRCLVTGASGLVGSRLVPLLREHGHDVARLVRRAPLAEDEISWEPGSGRLDPDDLDRLDRVVHLAGEGIATRRWSERQRQRIVDSRVQGTRLLCERLARCPERPSVLVSASAVGAYGDRGDEELDESSARGTGFLAETARVWEEATRPAEEAGIRVVHLRTGLVLDPAGGLLQRVLTPFRLGVGGVLGSGRQYMSWISREDLCRAILHCLENEELSGPVNGTAPAPVTNREFTKTLGSVLGRPTIFPAPAFVLRLVFGREFADEMLLGGCRVAPKRLEESDFQFQHRDLESALRALLGGA